MKKKLPTILLILALLTGLSLLLYPTLSDYWNSLHQSKAIASYADEVADLEEEDYEKMIADARAYNKALAEKPQSYVLSDEEQEEYDSLLDISGTGIMSYIEIAKLGVSLPIYHGTDEGVLQVAIGHIPGSSLPVGGTGTHCVVSGHRGLPSAKLFTDLDKLEEGDTFVVRTLDETMTYEVDQIRIVLPEEIEDLKIIEGEDLFTLVTCTPYGLNTHRLLVRGHRVENQEDASSILATADAMQVDTILVAPIVAIPLVILWLIWMFRDSGQNTRRSARRKEFEKYKAEIAGKDDETSKPDKKEKDGCGASAVDGSFRKRRRSGGSEKKDDKRR